MKLVSLEPINFDTFSLADYAGRDTSPSYAGTVGRVMTDGPDNETFLYHRTGSIFTPNSDALAAGGVNFNGFSGTVSSLTTLSIRGFNPTTGTFTSAFSDFVAEDLDIDGREFLNAIGSLTADDDRELLRGTLDRNEDVIMGTRSDDVIRTYGQNDLLIGAQGNDTLDGGAGSDAAIYFGDQANYTIRIGDGFVEVEGQRTAIQDGTDRLIGVEELFFNAASFVSTDPEEFVSSIERESLEANAQRVDISQLDDAVKLSDEQFRDIAEMYIAYFDRAPDAEGLLFWADAFANGTPLSEIAQLFSTSAEARAAFPPDASSEGFVTAVYHNVLGRSPDQDGLEFWVGVLDDGSVSRGEFVLELLGGARSEPGPNASQSFIQQQQADQVYLDYKIDIGIHFSAYRGMSDVNDAREVMDLFDGSASSAQSAIDAAEQDYSDTLSGVNSDELLLIQIVGIEGAISNDFV